MNALAFVAALALFIPVGVLPATSAAEAPDSFGGALVAGLRTIVGSGRVLAPMLLVVSVNLVYGGSLVCLAAYARVRLGSGETGLGVLTAALGAGALVGVFLANPLARTRRPMRAILVSALLAGLPFALLAVVGQQAVAAGLLVVAGAASIVTEVLAVTLLQRELQHCGDRPGVRRARRAGHRRRARRRRGDAPADPGARPRDGRRGDRDLRAGRAVRGGLVAAPPAVGTASRAARQTCAPLLRQELTAGMGPGTL